MGAAKKYDTDFMRNLFITGEKSLRAISNEYGISYTHLSKMSSKEEWSKAKKEYLTTTMVARRDAKIKKLDDEMSDLRKVLPLKAEEHQKRCMQTGDKLGTLIQTGVHAAKTGDWKTLRAATETWKLWDEQMRKNHGIENASTKPLVNIQVLAALPSREEMEAAKNNTVVVDA
tara:strand:- start:5255 stop:5773 length:519 start_codon:yes stop_codon:yes gene_type:complete